MKWKHYSVLHKCVVTACGNQMEFKVHIEIGRLHTGRARVYMGGYCRVEYGNTQICTEEDSIWKAVFKAVELLGELHVSISLYALEPDFYESGHSSGTGWGYISGRQTPVLMIDEVQR